jgi:hypothetical protein
VFSRSHSALHSSFLRFVDDVVVVFARVFLLSSSHHAMVIAPWTGRRAKSLRIGVHIADAVVWEPV